MSVTDVLIFTGGVVLLSALVFLSAALISELLFPRPKTNGMDYSAAIQAERDTRRAIGEAYVARMGMERWKHEHPDWKRWVIPCDCDDGCSRPTCTNR
jgi:hypothetical protein